VPGYVIVVDDQCCMIMTNSWNLTTPVYFSGGIRTKISFFSCYDTFELDESYFLIWAGTVKLLHQMQDL
jgi:hypothetical protein